MSLEFNKLGAEGGDGEDGPHGGANGDEGGGRGDDAGGESPHGGADVRGRGGGEVDSRQGGSVREMVDFWERVGGGSGESSSAARVDPGMVMEEGGVRVGVPARGRGRGRAGRPRTRVVTETGRGRRRVDTAYTWNPMNRDAYERTHSVVPQRYERGEGGSYNEHV